MTSKAHVERDPRSFGLRIAVLRDHGDWREMLRWEPIAVARIEPGHATEPVGSDWLQIPEDDARAIYEALADHFGHAGHDIRALRQDYNSERRRVDLMIDALIKRGA